MLRSAAPRSLLKSFAKVPIARSSYSAASVQFRNPRPLRQLNNNRPQVRIAIPRLTTTQLLYATNKAGPPFDVIDEKAEQKIAKTEIEPHPSEVSAESSVRHVFEKSQSEEKGDDMTGAIKADLKTIKETFSLADVPRESLYIGAAGVIPYAATSLSTVYLAYDINHAHDTGRGILFSPETAHQLLDIITPRSNWIRRSCKAQILENSRLYVLKHRADNFFPRSHPLGSRICRIWRTPQLSPIRLRSHCSCSCLAHNLHASRICLDHSILDFQLPLLCRRSCYCSWMVPRMVLCVSFCSHLFRGCLDRYKLDWTRPDCQS